MEYSPKVAEVVEHGLILMVVKVVLAWSTSVFNELGVLLRPMGSAPCGRCCFSDHRARRTLVTVSLSNQGPGKASSRYI